MSTRALAGIALLLIGGTWLALSQRGNAHQDDPLDPPALEITGHSLPTTGAGLSPPPVALTEPSGALPDVSSSAAWSYHGHAFDSLGEPLSDVEVIARDARSPHSILARTTTGETGSYDLVIAGPARAGMLIASGPTLAPDQVPLPRRDDSSGRSRVDFHLTRAAEISGRITWEDGRPCSNAELAVLRLGVPSDQAAQQLRAPLSTARCDQNGTFRGLRLGMDQIVRLRIVNGTHSPFADQTRFVSSAPEQEWAIVIPRPVNLLVQLRDDPARNLDLDRDLLEESLVRLWLASANPEFIAQAQLERGSARLLDVDPSIPYRVELDVPGYATAQLASSVVLEPRDSVLQYDIPELDQDPPWAAPPPIKWSFSWRAVSAEGRTLSLPELIARLDVMGSQVGSGYAESLSETAEQPFVLECVGPEATGTVHMTVLPPVRANIGLARHGLIETIISPDDVVELQVRDEELRPGITFRTVDSVGRWVPAPLLQLRSISTGELRLLLLEPPPAAAPVLVTPGDYAISARALGGYAPVQQQITVAPADHGRVIDVVFSEGGVVRGALVPPPRAGELVELFVSPAGTPWTPIEHRPWVDARGAFEIASLPAGLHTISAWVTRPDGALSACGSSEANVIAGNVVDVAIGMSRQGDSARITLVNTTGDWYRLWLRHEHEHLDRRLDVPPNGIPDVWLPLGVYSYSLVDRGPGNSLPQESARVVTGRFAVGNAPEGQTVELP